MKSNYSFLLWLLASPVFAHTRKAERELPDGSRLQFIRNKGDEWQTISVALDKKFSGSYWLDPTSGTILRNSGSTVAYQMPPYGSVLLFASAKNDTPDVAQSTRPVLVNPKEEVLTLSNWNIKVDRVEVKDSPLFDWKTHEQLKFTSAEGIYASTFPWTQPTSARHFFLDLGKVCIRLKYMSTGSLPAKEFMRLMCLILPPS